jgi:hypothetical protein
VLLLLLLLLLLLGGHGCRVACRLLLLWPGWATLAASLDVVSR